MPELRTLRPDEIDQVADLTARVFGDPEEVEPMRKLMQAAYETCPYMPIETCFVAVEDGRVVTKWQVLDFEMWVAGTRVRMGGIQATVAEPWANHKGYARDVAMFAAPRLQEAGFDFALGFAQRGAFYLRIGAVPVCPDYTLEMDARQVTPLREDPFRLAGEDDVPEIVRRYNESNAHGTGPLVRSEALWPWLVRRAESTYLCEDGYVGVTLFDDRIEVREVAGRGAAFNAAAVSKVADLARAAGLRRIQGFLAPDHPFFAAAQRYGAELTTRYSKKSGCLALPIAPVRLVTRIAETMTRRLAESRFADVALDLGITSPNESERLDLNPKGRMTRKIDLDLSPGAALQLAMGYRSVGDVLVAEASRQPAALTEDDVALLETALPLGHPFMWHTDRY